jgi:hypothetical protein
MRFAVEHDDQPVEFFAFDMEREEKGDSLDAALLETYTRIWNETRPVDDSGITVCCLQFLTEELVGLRHYNGADLIRILDGSLD